MHKCLEIRLTYFRFSPRTMIDIKIVGAKGTSTCLYAMIIWRGGVEGVCGAGAVGLSTDGQSSLL